MVCGGSDKDDEDDGPPQGHKVVSVEFEAEMETKSIEINSAVKRNSLQPFPGKILQFRFWGVRGVGSPRVRLRDLSTPQYRRN